jgi:hypothetical protein
MHFIYIYTVYIIAHVVGVHYITYITEAFRKNKSKLHASVMAHKNNSAHTNAQRFE